MAHKTNIGLRKEIRKLFSSGKSIQWIMQEKNLSYFQVYNAITGRVKLTRSPRSDKGSTRGLSEKCIDENGQVKSPDEIPEDTDQLLEYQLTEILIELNGKKISLQEKIRIIKDVSTLQKNINARKLEKHMKRPDAVLISRLIRRYNPNASDEDIIKIYNEEYEKLARDLQ